MNKGDLVRVHRRGYGVEGRIGIFNGWKKRYEPGRPNLAIVLIRGIPKLLELSDLEVISETG